MLETEIKKLNDSIATLIEALNKLSAPKHQVVIPEQLELPKKSADAPKKSTKSATPTQSADLDDVKKALMALASKTDRETAKKLLSDFSANKLSDLKQSDYLALIKKAEELTEK